MKSFTRFTLATTLLASAVSAQEQYSINPDSVDSSLRDFWCQQQQAQCPLICLQYVSNSDSTNTNDCDPDGLTYACVCSNGVSPNVTQYSQTLPFYICQEWGNQCVSNCNGDTTCQTDCRDNHPCGAQNPTRQNTSTLTRTMSATASSSGSGDSAATTDSSGETIYSGFGGGSASSTGGSGDSGSSSSNNNGGGSESGASTLVRVWALSAGQTFGTIAFVGTLVGGFAVLL